MSVRVARLLSANIVLVNMEPFLTHDYSEYTSLGKCQSASLLYKDIHWEKCFLEHLRGYKYHFAHYFCEVIPMNTIITCSMFV